MSERLLSLLKAIGTPGSIGFLGVCCAAGLVLGALGPRSRRVARAWLLLVYVSYAAGGIPRVAYAVARGLPAYPPLPIEAVHERGMLIVLGGDNAVGRVREAQRLLTAMPLATVIVSGSPWIFDALVASRFPRERIRFDGHSANTLEQIMRLAPLIRQAAPHGVIVASRLQMPRVAALARVHGLDVRLAPSPLDTEPPEDGLGSFVPRYTALRLTRDALIRACGAGLLQAAGVDSLRRSTATDPSAFSLLPSDFQRGHVTDAADDTQRRARPRVLQVVLSLNPGGTERLVVEIARRLHKELPDGGVLSGRTRRVG